MLRLRSLPAFAREGTPLSMTPILMAQLHRHICPKIGGQPDKQEKNWNPRLRSGNRSALLGFRLPEIFRGLLRGLRSLRGLALFPQFPRVPEPDQLAPLLVPQTVGE